MNNYMFIICDTNGIGTFIPPTQTVTKISLIHTDCNLNILHKETMYVKGAKQLNKWCIEQGHDLNLINNGKPYEDVLYMINKLIDSKTLFISHNCQFHLGLLNLLKYKHICTSTNKIMLTNLEQSSYIKLGELAQRLNIAYMEMNEAEYNVNILFRCFQELKKRDLFIEK